MSEQEPLAKVFASYARSTSVLLSPLVTELRAAGAETWLDTASIEKTADWWDEISQGIRDADTVPAFLPPEFVEKAVAESMSSRTKADHPCNLRHSWSEPTVVQWIPAINWVGLDDYAGPRDVAAELFRLSRTDHSWTREHSRLLSLASAWDLEGRRRFQRIAALVSIVSDPYVRRVHQPQ